MEYTITFNKSEDLNTDEWEIQPPEFLDGKDYQIIDAGAVSDDLAGRPLAVVHAVESGVVTITPCLMEGSLSMYSPSASAAKVPEPKVNTAIVMPLDDFELSHENLARLEGLGFDVIISRGIVTLRPEQGHNFVHPDPIRIPACDNTVKDGLPIFWPDQMEIR